MGLQLAQNRGHSVARGWPRRSAAGPTARTARAVEVAEHNAEAAALHYQQLRAAAAAGAPPRGPLRSWQQMVLLVVGGGLMLGVLFLWLLTTMYLGYVALLALPVIAGLAAMVVVRARKSPTVRRPTVDDLVRAVRELREAEAAVRRAHARDGAAAVGPASLTPPGEPTTPSSTPPPGPALR
jgi:hypothetical protein